MPVSRSPLVCPILLLAIAAAACGGADFPRDPAGTLEEVRAGTLRVGVAEAPPWVIRRGDEAAGVEAELARRFADGLNAEIEWHWGPTHEHMEALVTYDLDLSIGGYLRSTPWRRHVGTTAPYHTTRILVAAPPGEPPPAEATLEGRLVAVAPAHPMAEWVRDRGAEPRATEAPGEAELVAAPVWRLLLMGRDTLGVELGKTRHVMAVPPGENGFLMALENVLHRADVDRLLLRWGDETP